jgi:hypothetical protein
MDSDAEGQRNMAAARFGLSAIPLPAAFAISAPSLRPHNCEGSTFTGLQFGDSLRCLHQLSTSGLYVSNFSNCCQ